MRTLLIILGLIIWPVGAFVVQRSAAAALLKIGAWIAAAFWILAAIGAVTPKSEQTATASRPAQSQAQERGQSAPTADTSAADEHFEAAQEYRESSQFGLALVELDQAIAIRRGFSAAESMRTEVRAEATRAIQEANAAATAEASRPITIDGRGLTATAPFRPPAAESRVSFAHNGRSNFIVEAHVQGRDRSELLVNKIGAYRGVRLLEANAPVTLDIRADGAWQVVVQPIPGGGQPAVSGDGDDVSRRFTPPGNGAWTFSHSGRGNFIVELHCSGARSQLIQNRIGAAEGSQVITFGRAPCFWEVRADGTWSLAPRA